MASKYWIKLYHEILDDPKMGMLSDRLYRRTIELFLMAGELDQNGNLPDVKSIAWRLRVSEDEMLNDLNKLAKVNIVTFDGNWIVTKFSDRQSAMSNAERINRYRNVKQSCNENCNENVTNRYTDIDIDKDIDTDKIRIEAKSEAPTTDLVSSRYESDFGILTPLSSEKLKDLQATYPQDWIIDAMKLAVEKNARNLSYVEAILKRWKAEGKDNGKKAGKAKGPPERTADDYKKAWGKA